jgi:SAM-dependent methyltransferase
MNDINNQVDYWNDVAWKKEFTHAVDLSLLRELLPLDSRILDFGCGYGRVSQELVQAGYRDVTGVDSSAEMIRRGRHQYPHLRLEALGSSGFSYPANSFDAVLLIAVLTCIPEDQGQQALLAALKAVLRPGALLYISDYLLQADERNQQRYQQHLAELGRYGVFRLPEGAVVRHHSREWLQGLTHDLETVSVAQVDATTMNGHAVRALRYVGRKR